MASTTNGMIYIIDTATLERLNMQHIPEKISWERTTEQSDVVIVSRNNPKTQYISGGETINLDLSFYAEERNRADVLRKFRWLKSLEYNDGVTSESPRVKIVFGKVFKKEIWKVTTVRGELSLFQKNYNMYPTLARVRVTFKLDTERDLRTRDVR